jgi:hypothetical protein
LLAGSRLKLGGEAGMATNKVLFMPYDPRHQMFIAAQYEYGSLGGEAMDKLAKDIEHETAKGNTAIAVWYQPNQRNPFLSSLNTGQIYIRGHGMPGFRSIEGGRGGERITYKTVVDRLIESGLRRAFTGKIKLFNCHSAESGTPGSDPECNGPPFAQQVADELYSRGFKHCTFYGYNGRIDSFVKVEAGGTHHYVRDFQNGRLVAGRRASEERVQFKPGAKSFIMGNMRSLFG